MNTPTLNRPPPAYEPGRTLTAAIAVALVLEAGLGLLLLGRSPQPIAQPVAPLRVTHVVTIADTPALRPPPRPAPPVVPPVHPEVQHSTPPKPRPALVPVSPKTPTPRETQPVTPTSTPAPAAVPAANTAPAPAQPAATPPTAKPSADHADGRRGVVPLTRIEPDYPKRALANNIEGSVIADLTIEQDGHVSDVRIVRAQPPGLFEHEAEKALRQWKFSASDSGIIGEVELNFTLN